MVVIAAAILAVRAALDNATPGLRAARWRVGSVAIFAKPTTPEVGAAPVGLLIELAMELAQFLFSASHRGRPVPHVVGLTRGDAARLIREAGYTAFTDRPDAEPDAMVIAQSPPAGKRRSADSAVRLRLSPRRS